MRANDHANCDLTTSEEREPENVQVFDIRRLAREFIIVGIKGKLLRVRRKSDGAAFWIQMALPEKQSLCQCCSVSEAQST